MDAGLLTLLLAASRHVFGGPNGPFGNPETVFAWTAAVLLCIGAAVGGIWLLRTRRHGAGVALVWAPAAAAIAIIVLFYSGLT